MIDILGLIFIVLGLVFIFIGSITIFLLKNFHLRLLVCSQIDTVGMLLFLIGILLKYHSVIYVPKIIIILLIALIINPITSYAIGKSAYLRGEHPKKEFDE